MYVGWKFLRETIDNEKEYRMAIGLIKQKNSRGADKGSGATPQQDASTETADDRIDSLSSSDPTPELRTYNVKLGWIQGVLIPCLLNIWGVMLFLRIAWIVAQAGTVLTTGIILFTAFVCVITALSLSAICTNGELKGGGVYYIVSRSLGAELGASLGIILAFANAVAASMNTIGFCDSLNELLKTSNLKIIDNGPNDVRIVGAISLCVMCVICAIGMDWESKVQNSLIVIIVLAIFTYIIGACIGPSDDVERSKGFVGINADTYNNNLWPDFRYSDGRRHDVFSVFAMFFPAMTGVQAGANICGDLRQPAKAIPKGTLLAIGISTISYLVMAWLCGVGAARDASGAVADVASGTLDSCKPNCQYGLHNHYTIMQIMAWSSVIIYAGCWAATLSTALTNLLSVPRLIQALGVDHIYPGLIFFSKPYGKHGEPYRGYVLTFFVSLVFVLIGELNTVAPLITNFYLASYALINFCTFHAALVHHINWRPTFKYYNTWLSLAGFMLCMFVMVVISWVMALLTILIFLVLFLIVLYRKPDVNWASSTDAQRYKDAVSTLVQLSHKEKNIKSYNPQVLVLAGQPLLRPALLDIGHMITRLGSFMIVADICEDSLSNVERMHRLRMGEEWLQTRGNRGFYVIMDGQPFEEGVRTVLRTSGLGHLKPNIMLIGFQNRWNTYPASRVSAYVRVIQLAYEQHLGLTILRVPETARPQQDPAPPPPELGENSKLEMHFHNQVQTVMHRHSDEEIDKGNQENPVEVNDKNSRALAGADVAAGPNNASGGKITSLSMRRLGVYRPLIFGAETNVDAWWLYDDGGLNILLPYIIARRGFKVKVPLRVFNLAKETNDLEEAEKRMVSILHEYRIEYSSLTMIRGLSDPPRPESKQYFKNLVKEIKERSGDSLLNESELQGEQQKTNRHLRLRELLIDHSFTASLIVLTLPVPRQSLSSAHLYMAWLEVLSKDLPPVLFVRGNDESVLGV